MPGQALDTRVIGEAAEGALVGGEPAGSQALGVSQMDGVVAAHAGLL